MYVLIKGICTEKGRDTGTRNAGSAFAGWRECLCRGAVWERSNHENGGKGMRGLICGNLLPH